MNEDGYMNPTFSSTIEEVRRFIETRLWIDMEKLLNARLVELRNLLQYGTSMSVEEMRLIQGNLQALQDLKSLPHILLVTLEEEGGKGDSNE